MGQNSLYPIFLKLENLQTLLVGAGNVGLEKLTALLKNSPEARVTIVADHVCDGVGGIVEKNPNIKLLKRKFFISDLEGTDLLILATNDRSLHERTKVEARKKRILTNVADSPDLCDFYLGSVVQKGDLKIGISTNGKSPTFAKRFREYMEEFFPDNLQELVDNLNTIKNNLKGDFQYKVKALNELTSSFISKKPLA
ncbi:MAG: bifunctional precorrin-2 dehydrogenase/sirohydrochlorin ferrochelatase [Cyclobacteriaceae bacterium]|nr:bifunctional precorrin-2 dehydrogenase/sirohydrochlorin ferrochelatase [Cyclobacteriaceae bacterium]MCK5280186.1 bifunctional precorrin-2 dehydrogenase/sirohydrochlorin ferrochelatase [Cyclobacteriaceae bacterium]MCK5368425.1 bifunctional precorrin-2 dehydrogenase/sirohydrochlorin ferrochelatase [Cyclobacteriaceae bacterium]MCK5470961.1 bifunctional precorrin-2 dehydrogenase/sirohydrochlorin ferrochelatase [Cyclobacteriaceae bacterium]